MLYPLKFMPIYKEKIWGGQKIKTVLKKDYGSLANCGELWALSGVPGDESVVDNGFLKGNTMNELVEVYMDELVGEAVYEKFGNIFPVLIKFLNADSFLSVQVHPDDKLAMERHNSYGKNEMWYIIDAEKDSELIIGFKEGTDSEKYRQKMQENKLQEILNHVKVGKGDAFYMPAGRVHAIGKGILLAEIQQTSDITYRIYDWDRTDDKGQKRELHTQQAVAAIDYAVPDDYYSHYARLNNLPSPIVETPAFTVNYLPLTQPTALNYSTRDSFTAFVCIEGGGAVIYNNEHYHFASGETVLIPANIYDITLQPHTETVLLEVFI